MKLNRRRMMGVAAGAALAGPQTIGAIARQAPMPAMPPPYYGVGAEMAKDATPEEWTLNYLAKLKRIAAGDIRNEDKNYPTEGPPQPYVALRSISENARHFMHNRHYERRWRERTIAEAMRALDEYDKTGLLRTFL
jgi:hypothetical protein